MNRIANSITAATVLVLGASVPAAAQQNIVREVTRSVTTTVAKTAHIGSATVHQKSDFKFEQKDVKTEKLAVGPTGQVSLRNIVGNITVKAGGGNDASLEIIRLSRGRTEADAKLGLEKVTVDVSVRGERATVEARYPDERRTNYGVSVSYNLTAPAGTGVTIDTVSGELMVTGLKGDVIAHAISGKIDLTNCSKVSSARTTSGDITLNNVQGAANLEVEAISGDLHLTNVKATRVSASIVSGTIVASDVQADSASLSAMSGDLTYSGSVAPKGRYEFRAQSGTIKLGLTGGFDLEARTFSGTVATEPALSMATTSANPKTVRGTVGNGGASVSVTTFSGSIWVGRTIK